MKLKELIRFLEDFAPLSYQESYDNSGLLIGKPDITLNGAMITLDCTEDVINEAHKKKCNVIICHHPLIFGGIKKLTGSNYVERCISLAIKKDIAIYAIHTNLDNVHNGVNSMICKKLGLLNYTILSPKSDLLNKLIVYCPFDIADKVRNAMFDAGAGNIGEYSECSFSSEGEGTFKASKTSTPYVGEKGKRHLENEVKIECIVPVHLKNRIITSMIAAHPYEEVAYDLFPLANYNERVGSGMIGELKKPMTPASFLKLVKNKMLAKSIRYTDIKKKLVRKVAVCGGSGSFLINQAKLKVADVFLTSDLKYHQFFDSEGELMLVDIGHYESEQFTKELLYELINKKFPKFAVRLSETNTNPIKYC